MLARMLLAALLLAGALYPVGASAADKRIPAHDDVWLMKRVGAPQVSPDGRWIVVSVVEPSYEHEMQLSDLWLIDTRGRNASRRLTSTRRPESGVTWSPDGRRILFSAQREGDDVAQIYSLDLASGGEAQRVTNASGGARNPTVSPDGTQLAYVTLMYPDAKDDAENKVRMQARRDRKANVRVFDGFPIRNWDRWLDERRVRILVQPLDGDGMASGAPRDLLAGTRLFASPGFSGRQTDTGEELEIEFTPDSKALVFAASTNRNQAAHAFVDAQLFVVDLSGGEPRALTSGSASWSKPRFTPDGRTLLALHEQVGPKVYNATRLAAIAWPRAGGFEIISGDLDRSVEGFAISPDSRQVYFTAEDAGREKIYSVRVGGGRVQPLLDVDEGSFTDIAMPEQPAAKPVLYGRWDSAQSPSELVAILPGTGKTARVTQFNATRAAALDLPAIEDFWFTSSRGKRIHSFLVRPPGFDPAKKYP